MRFRRGLPVLNNSRAVYICTPLLLYSAVSRCICEQDTRRIPYFRLSETATATATVAPTMGLLPIENPEISLFYFGSKVQILHHFSIFIKQSSVLIVSHFI